MPVPIYKKKQKVYMNNTVHEKYVIGLYRTKPLNFDEVADRISQGSTLAKGEIYLALEQIEQQIYQLLQNGFPIQFGVLGSFYPSLEAKTVDKKEDLTVKTIKRYTCIFKPSKFLKRSFKRVEFRFIDKQLAQIRKDLK